MLPFIYALFLSKPRLTRSLGELLGWIGTTGCAIGLIATFVNQILALTTALSKQTPPTFAQIVAPMPTWWVPESLLGFAVYSVFIFVGYLLLESSRRLQRLYGR